MNPARFPKTIIIVAMALTVIALSAGCSLMSGDVTLSAPHPVPITLDEALQVLIADSGLAPIGLGAAIAISLVRLVTTLCCMAGTAWRCLSVLAVEGWERRARLATAVP
jgi:hypothetical protein